MKVKLAVHEVASPSLGWLGRKLDKSLMGIGRDLTLAKLRRSPKLFLPACLGEPLAPAPRDTCNHKPAQLDRWWQGTGDMHSNHHACSRLDESALDWPVQSPVVHLPPERPVPHWQVHGAAWSYMPNLAGTPQSRVKLLDKC
jgi:hypothetical protein